jgi:hypothetical protein
VFIRVAPWPASSKQHNPDIRLRAWIDLEVVRELATEAGHFDCLSLGDATYIDPSRGTNEYVDVARAVVDDDDEPKRTSGLINRTVNR